MNFDSSVYPCGARNMCFCQSGSRQKSALQRKQSISMDFLIKCLNRYLDCDRDPFLETEHPPHGLTQLQLHSPCWLGMPLSVKHTRPSDRQPIPHESVSSGPGTTQWQTPFRRIEWNEKGYISWKKSKLGGWSISSADRTWKTEKGNNNWISEFA